MLRISVCAGALALATATSASTQEAPPYRMRVDYSQARFNADLPSWHVMSIEAEARGVAGTLLARATLADRFDQFGHQIEVDAYPRLSPNVYAYLNAGYSPSDIFPTWRYGAELYAAVPGGFEVSAGARLLAFDERDVVLYTGSLGKYIPNYYGALRPTLSFRDGEALFSAGLLVRRYLGDTYRYVDLRAGRGESPLEDATPLDLDRILSTYAGLNGLLPVSDRMRVLWRALFEKEDLPQRSRQRWTGGLGLEVVF
jgi:YaiO family outer membrane protein